MSRTAVIGIGVKNDGTSTAGVYENLTEYYSTHYPHIVGAWLDDGKWDGHPRVMFQYIRNDKELYTIEKKYNDIRTAQEHYVAIAGAMEKERKPVDIYTATQQAYKNGKADGQAGAMTWVPGKDIPDTVERALIQKESGSIHLMEQPYLGRAVRMWSGITAWCEVKPFRPGD
jgi:hypothetical protein